MKEEYLIFSGKKYISSKRASQISGYSMDYIGQLARGGKLKTEMVGRNRYVCESTLLEYLYSINVQGTGVGRKKSSEGEVSFNAGQKTNKKIISKNQEKNISDNRSAEGLHIEKEITETAPVLSPEVLSPIKNSEARVVKEVLNKFETEDPNKNFEEDKSFVPKIKKAEDFIFPSDKKEIKNNTSQTLINTIAATAVVAMLIFFVSSPVARLGFDNFASSRLIYESNPKEQIANVVTTRGSKTVRIIRLLDDTFLPYFDRADKAIISFFQSLRNKSLGIVANIKTKLTREETNTTVTENTILPGENSLNTSSSTEFVLDENALKLLVREILLEEADIFAPGVPQGGLVVDRSSGDQETDEEVRRRIEESFSDEVIVELADDRRGGIVRPVFRNSEDANNEYLFVLVPVDQ